MAKFKFTLSSVEKYRNITLDEAKAKYAKAVADVNKQIETIVNCKAKLTEIDDELNEKNKQGITALEYQGYKRYIKVLENNIKQEEDKLKGLQKIEQRRRAEMITEKTNAMSIEKIKEKRFEEYKKEEAKKADLAIQEFVSHKLSSPK